MQYGNNFANNAICEELGEKGTAKIGGGQKHVFWICRYARVGSVVMLLHDPSDVFLEAAKLCNYAELEGPSTVLFAGLLLSWFGLRLVLLPFWVMHSCMCAHPHSQPFLVCHIFKKSPLSVTAVIWKVALSSAILRSRLDAVPWYSCSRSMQMQ